jgi:hypothetical protein
LIGRRRSSSPSCESMAPNAKLEMFICKIKGLVGFAWIKNEVVEKTFKDWTAFFASTPHEKGWSFQVKWVRGAIIVEQWAMKCQ